MRYVGRIVLTGVLVCVAWTMPAVADDGPAVEAVPVDHQQAAQHVVEQAQRTFSSFVADPNMKWFKQHVGNARAILIVPELGRAGFILGASGGRGVMLGRDANGTWSSPVFYNLGAASFGFQAGIAASEVVLLAMTEKGRDAFLSTKVQLGAEANVAAWQHGGGAQAATTDILSFARTKGVFGGLTVEGAVIKPDDDRNSAYYGGPVSPVDIVVRRSVANQHAADLINAVTYQTGG